MRVMARSLAESGYREEGGEHGVDRRDDARRGGIGVLIDLKVGELLIHVDAADAEGAGADVVLDAGLERGVRRGGAGDRRILPEDLGGVARQRAGRRRGAIAGGGG